MLHSCAPATIGLNGQDVLDETYRKAGKLDKSQFSVDFDPHDYGVVDAIAQTLLPGIGKMLRECNQRSGEISEHWGGVLSCISSMSILLPQAYSTNTFLRRGAPRSLAVWLFACLLLLKVPNFPSKLELVLMLI